MQESDQYWLEKLKSRRPRDFNEFFDHFFPRLYRFSMARLRNPDWAEEAVQEGLSRGIMKIDSYLGEAALFSWLCTITRHEISRILKRELVASDKVFSIEDEMVVAALESLESLVTEDPENQYRRLQLSNCVRMAMASLPVHYANVLEWRYLQGNSVGDIAKKLDKSYKATESLLSRSREVFKDAFISIVDSDLHPDPVEDR